MSPRATAGDSRKLPASRWTCRRCDTCALQLGVAATTLGHVVLPSLGRQVADGVQEELTGLLQVEWHGETILRVLYLAVRIHRPIRPERKEKIGPALGSLSLQQATEASSGIGPVLIGGGTRDAERLCRILDRESREVAKLDQLGGLWVFRTTRRSDSHPLT